MKQIGWILKAIFGLLIWSSSLVAPLPTICFFLYLIFVSMPMSGDKQ